MKLTIILRTSHKCFLKQGVPVTFSGLGFKRFHKITQQNLLCYFMKSFKSDSIEILGAI